VGGVGKKNHRFLAILEKKIQQLVKFNPKKIVKICQALVGTSTSTSAP